VAGGLTACTALLMAVAPRAPWAFIFFSITYSFFNGMAFAAFTGFVLETIGKGAAATKYNIFASVANQAVSYMVVADGFGNRRWGATGAVLTDGLLTFAGIGVLLGMVALVRVTTPKPAAVSEAAASM
jgi:hypothetical protein